MSLNTLLIMGVCPLGDFPAGALIAGIGGPLTAGLSAALTGVYALFLAATPTSAPPDPSIWHGFLGLFSIPAAIAP